MSGPVVLVLRLVLVFSLYAFLGWAFINLFREINQQGLLLASRKVPSLGLTIKNNNQAHLTKHFGDPEVTIGRDPNCECPVDDTAISALHARLHFHHNQWWLEDLQSTNGTLLNQLTLSVPTVVMSGDEFKCGGTTFLIALTGETILSSK
jgi:pSer/pThr/pTyr-binding forkhead associated (FHA) protein